MPYYKDINVLFIHIPKTGGTNIEKILKKKYKQTLYGYREDFNPFKPPYEDVQSLQHQFYTTIFKLKEKFNINFDNVKIFSIVRNPYDRIISDLFFLKLANKNHSSDKIYNIIKNNYLNKYYNDKQKIKYDKHWEPQYKYITDENCNLIPNIKIFRTETLNQCNDELNKYLGIKINIIKNGTKNYNKYLNRQSIDLINNYYKKDFELLGYEMR